MPFHPPVEAWFREAFGAPTAPQTRAWPAIAAGDSTLILAPTGSGKTLAAFLACLDRLMFSPVPEPQRTLPRALHLAAEGAGRRHRAQPARADCGHRPRRRGAGRCAARALDRDSHGRHASFRARPLPAPAIRHPDHDARIAVSPADLTRTRGLARARHRHHRRDPCAAAHQAGRPPGAVARAAGGADAATAPADRPLGHGSADRRGRDDSLAVLHYASSTSERETEAPRSRRRRTPPSPSSTRDSPNRWS